MTEPDIEPGTCVLQARWIKMIELPRLAKTRRVLVETADGQSLGTISWYPPWRKYTFCPPGQTVFEQDCLRAIADFLDHMMQERKR